MDNSTRVDLVKFICTQRKSGKKEFWHIQKQGALPGFYVKVTCGDVGRAAEIDRVAYGLLNGWYICRDCKSELKDLVSGVVRVNDVKDSKSEESVESSNVVYMKGRTSGRKKSRK